MKLCRTCFLAGVGCFAAALPLLAVDNPEDPIDLEELKKASLVPFCEYMKRQNPHIRDWKKGELPTEKELKALIKRSPSIEKELRRIREEFLREIEADETKRNQFRKKRRR